MSTVIISPEVTSARKLALVFNLSGVRREEYLHRELVSEVGFVADEFGGTITFPEKAVVVQKDGTTSDWYPLIEINHQAEILHSVTKDSVFYWVSGKPTPAPLKKLTSGSLVELLKDIAQHGLSAQ